MTDPRNFRLRVTYTKGGRLALLSHLELIRALERAVRRANLPFAVSEGFSPHMKIAFGAALPVGVGGKEEIFDLQLKEYVPEQDALAALQAASVPDLYPKAAKYVEPSTPAASVAFPNSTYEAEFDGEIEQLYVPDVLTIVRKKKEKELVVSDFLRGTATSDGATVQFTLESKPTGSLRPDKLLEAIAEGSTSRTGEPLHVVRTTRIAQEA